MFLRVNVKAKIDWDSEPSLNNNVPRDPSPAINQGAETLVEPKLRNCNHDGHLAPHSLYNSRQKGASGSAYSSPPGLAPPMGTRGVGHVMYTLLPESCRCIRHHAWQLRSVSHQPRDANVIIWRFRSAIPSRPQAAFRTPRLLENYTFRRHAPYLEKVMNKASNYSELS